VIDRSDTICEKAKKYVELCEQIKSVEKEVEYLKKELLKEIGSPRTAIDLGGSFLRAQKIRKEGSVDYRSIPELSSVDLSLYRKPSIEYWKFSLA
jgi:hypothetical protein